MPRIINSGLARFALGAVFCFFISGVVRADLDAPVSPHAQPGVGSLRRVLDGISGRYILSGQQELGWDARRVDEDIAYIRKTTGKSPVIRGLDFGQYTQDPSSRMSLHETERAIAWAKQGGVVTFSCHLFSRNRPR